MGTRGDREQERAELAGLHGELLEQKDWIERAIATDEHVAAAVQQLNEAAEAGLSAGRILVRDSVLRTVGNTTFFDPSLSRFESIIASGRLGLIRDNDLRAAIADWPNAARYPQYAANSRREMFRNQFIPFLIAGYDVRDWLGPGRRPAGALIELPVDGTFINMLGSRAWMDGVVLGTERSVARRLDDLLPRLEAAGAR